MPNNSDVLRMEEAVRLLQELTKSRGHLESAKYAVESAERKLAAMAAHHAITLRIDGAVYELAVTPAPAGEA